MSQSVRVRHVFALARSRGVRRGLHVSASLRSGSTGVITDPFVPNGVKIRDSMKAVRSPMGSLEGYLTGRHVAGPFDHFSDSPAHDARLSKVLQMLVRLDNLTLGTILGDPVICNSTIQAIIECSPDFLASTPGQDCIIATLNRKDDQTSGRVSFFLQLLCSLYKQNESIRLITLKLLTELMFSRPNSLQHNRDLILQFLDALFRRNPVIANHLESTLKPWIDTLKSTDPRSGTLQSSIYLTQYNFFKFIVICSLISQNPLLAASLYIQQINSNHSNNFVNYLLLNNELLLSITSSLLVLDPSSDHKNLLTIIKLQEFQNQLLTKASRSWSHSVDIEPFRFKLSDSQQNQLLSNLLTLDDNSTLPLKVYIFEKVLKLQLPEKIEGTDHLAIYLRYAYQLIESNILLNNDAIVYFIWSQIEKYHTIIYNAQINSPNNNPENNFYYYSVLSKIIKFFSKNKRYSPLVDKLIQNVPIKSCHVNPELMDALLIHAARNEDQELSEILIKQLGSDYYTTSGNFKYVSHLTRGQLSSLLGLHLRFHDSEGAEKIVNLINQRYPRGLDHVEMNLICKQILNGKGNPIDQEQKIWNMFQSLDAHLGKSITPLLIDRMIETRRMDFEKIDSMFQKMVSSLSKHDEVWEWYSGLYVKYLCRNFSLIRAQKLYQRSESSLSFYNSFNNPFSKPSDKSKIFLPQKSKKLILKTILDSSVFIKGRSDLNITFWCFEELEKLGYDYKEIMLDLSLTKKDLVLKTCLEFNLSNKTKKENNDLYLPGSTTQDRRLSLFFEEDFEKLYFQYLKLKNSPSRKANL